MKRVVAVITFLLILLTIIIVMSQQRTFAGTITIGGQKLVCQGYPVSKVRLLGGTPGANNDGRVLIDPKVLRQEKLIVQKFIFFHECGHSYVGLSEYKADCWATQHGVKNKWLRLEDIPDICLSFAGPSTSTHPSGDSRCANIYHCFSNERKQEAKK